ncbi:DUF1553 domain-containing protein [Thalassotalea crassostreae]|uniref:DUF1553 domain-containing protein n=1 Tax=Thalassotalea crassostreae TaxID=1763536 RepID=UPI000838AD47|nr:DUF1553 domain-containing protein [Thalassotalea crassostreae]
MKKILILTLFYFCLPVFAADDVNFDRDIRPILSDKCYFCHGPDAEDIKGDLQLHTFEKATSERGDYGPAIVPGKPEESLLWELVNSEYEDEIMPPTDRHMPLTADEKDKLRRWIIAGAEYDVLWSFKPLPKEVPVPKTAKTSSRNPVDLFIAEKLEEIGFAPSPQAKSEQLLRRVYLSLTGLLPTVEQIDAYNQDNSKNKYEKLVDSLLKSPAFAERLAVDWMDLSRYADSYGYQTDRAREVWPYRDWVLKALRKNMPYDQFIMQQLAGDMMEDSTDDMKLATAFNRMHTQKNEGGSTSEEFRTEYVADRTQTAGTAFLGLTMECARCHDHKYDPITQEDYFSTYALFNNIDESGLHTFFTGAVPSPTMHLINDKKKESQAKLQQQLTQAEKELLKLISEEVSNFEEWQNSWDGKVQAQGKIAQFSFESLKDDHILVNELDTKTSAYFYPEYTAKVPGVKGFAAKLDGDAALNFGDLGPYKRHLGFSYSVWLNTPEHLERAFILGRNRGRYDAGSRGYELIMDEGRLSAALVHFSPGNEIRIRTQDKIKLATWQQVTVTYDGSASAEGIKLFIDGELAKTEIIKDHLTKPITYEKKVKRKKREVAKISVKESLKFTPDFRIGASFRDNGFKDGLVDELQFFSRPLSAIEVKSLFTQQDLSPSKEELYDYYLTNFSTKYKTAHQVVEDNRKALHAFNDKLLSMMIMKELPERRKTYVLDRGNYQTPDLNRLVEPKPPEFIFPFDGYSNDRLGFAQWLTHPEHPLTSRVAVNRYWQMIFGKGIVTTTNDFGMQGELPTHQQLLDYLSRYFIESDWDTRKLIKVIVMSDTFKQDSNMNEELYKKDPDNKYLARGPAYYMTAEMLRDNALYSGGLLSLKVGGKSVKPGNLDKGKYRRSLYTHWQRNSLSPEMQILGAPNREICSVTREETSTPLQSLVLMNSPQFVEGASGLAARVLKKGGSDIDKLQRIFLSLTSREAGAQEIKILTSLLTEQRTYFNDNPDITYDLNKVGLIEKKDLESAELAAWTVVASAVFNTDSSYMLR